MGEFDKELARQMELRRLAGEDPEDFRRKALAQRDKIQAQDLPLEEPALDPLDLVDPSALAKKGAMLGGKMALPLMMGSARNVESNFVKQLLAKADAQKAAQAGKRMVDNVIPGGKVHNIDLRGMSSPEGMPVGTVSRFPKLSKMADTSGLDPVLQADLKYQKLNQMKGK